MSASVCAGRGDPVGVGRGWVGLVSAVQSFGMRGAFCRGRTRCYLVETESLNMSAVALTSTAAPNKQQNCWPRCILMLMRDERAAICDLSWTL